MLYLQCSDIAASIAGTCDCLAHDQTHPQILVVAIATELCIAASSSRHKALEYTDIIAPKKLHQVGSK